MSRDLVLVLDDDAPSIMAVREACRNLQCELIEAENCEAVRAITGLRIPTVAVIAIDVGAADGISALLPLAALPERPRIVLIGRDDARLLASAHRLAASHGLAVLGTLERPVQADQAQRLLTRVLRHPGPIPPEEIEGALREQQFLLHYQPKAALERDGLRLCGVEALVRWMHPRLGLLHPAQFLDCITSQDQSTRLTDWVMTEAARQSGKWQEMGLALQMAINLDPKLIRDMEFADRLLSLLREYGVPPNRFLLDLTGTAARDDNHLILHVLTRLRVLGLELALDNFGTGFSSLCELHRMPFTEIKVDGSLTAAVPGDDDAMTIVQAVADLGRKLGLKVCAEGVERKETLDYLYQAGFDCAQGRIICMPTTAPEIEELARTWLDRGAGGGSEVPWSADQRGQNEPRSAPGNGEAAAILRDVIVLPASRGRHGDRPSTPRSRTRGPINADAPGGRPGP